MARFSASVQLNAKTTREGSSAPISACSRARASSTIRPASIAARWLERPGLALKRVSACTTASTTSGGLGELVAALSK